MGQGRGVGRLPVHLGSELGEVNWGSTLQEGGARGG